MHNPGSASFHGTRPTYSVLTPNWERGPESVQQSYQELVGRYLAAFGPATIADVQNWSGLSRLKGATLSMPGLVSFPGPSGGTLYDLPYGLQGGTSDFRDVILLPDYDNVIFGHRDRSRIMTDAIRRRLIPPAKRMQRIVLRRGFVGGFWKFEPNIRAKLVTISITIGSRPTSTEREAIDSEVSRLRRLLRDVDAYIEDVTLTTDGAFSCPSGDQRRPCAVQSIPGRSKNTRLRRLSRM